MSYGFSTSIGSVLRATHYNTVRSNLSTEQGIRSDQSYSALPSAVSVGNIALATQIINLRASTTNLVQYSKSYNDWYLPSKNELFALVHNLGNWYLPSKDELSLIWTNLVDDGAGNNSGLGSFASDSYWSSSQDTDANAWGCNFSSGVSSSILKSTALRLRAVITFVSPIVYALKDIGPNGGWIFYLLDNGDGSYTYMECASADYTLSTVFQYVWTTEAPRLLTGISTAFGYGKSNTVNVTALSGTSITTCTGLIINASIPTLVDNTRFWSSTEYDYDSVFINHQGISQTYNKNLTLFMISYTVTVRDFITSYDYSIRDVGPAGGYIFYKVEVNSGLYKYYEVKCSITSMTDWSNINSTLLGTTLAALGTGAANSAAIIAQSGHTASAAKNCLDYESCSSSSTFFWSTDVIAQITIIKASHLEEITQVTDDSNNDARCPNTCSATCGRGCSNVACRSTCSESCSTACTGSYCATGCSTECYSTCDGTCGNNCSGGCDGTCWAGCDTGCIGSCTGSSCFVSSQCLYGTCSAYCNDYCTTACYLNCTEGCESMSAGIIFSCQGGTCSTYCYSACSSSCISTCADGCSDNCTGSCGFSCSAICGNATCTSTCSATCYTYCGSSCTGNACRSNCSGTCSKNCYDTCTNGCGSSCSTTARTGTDPGDPFTGTYYD